jgi:hypothetical protein
VSGGDAIKTGFIAFFYSLRTIALPFMFIFNTDLLLIDVGLVQWIMVFIIATIAILVFTAGTMGYFITKSNIVESVVLILIAFALFRPDFFMNRITPPFEQIEPTQIVEAMGRVDPGGTMRVVISGPDFMTGDPQDLTLVLPVDGDVLGGAERLDALGLTFLEDGGTMTLEEPFFGTPFAGDMGDFDFYGSAPVTLSEVQMPAAQFPKELIWIPTLLLLGGVVALQMARAGRAPKEAIA